MDAADITTKSCSLESQLGVFPALSGESSPKMQTYYYYKHVIGTTDQSTQMSLLCTDDALWS